MFKLVADDGTKIFESRNEMSGVGISLEAGKRYTFSGCIDECMGEQVIELFANDRSVRMCQAKPNENVRFSFLAKYGGDIKIISRKV